MTFIRPFRGLRPQADNVEQVVAPPYDVVNREQAKALAQNKPHSFLHIAKAEIDLPDTVSAYDDQVYAKAADNLHQFLDQGILQQDDTDSYYVYRMKTASLTQTGLVAAASVNAYLNNDIRIHEFTRPDKETDRVKLTEALKAQMSPLLLAYRHDASLTALLNELSQTPATYSVTTADGVEHSLWRITDPNALQAITTTINAFPALYIADGHHRSAAAGRVATAHDNLNDANDPYNYFLAVMFDDQELEILGYHRVVNDLNGLTPEAFLEKVKANFSVEKTEPQQAPAAADESLMYLDKQWYKLKYKQTDSITEPLDALAVSILHNNLIEPVLGISDPRTDKRIDFVGGVHGYQALQQRVDAGEMQLAFLLHPTTMQQLLAVADSGQTMPPKSTWFEPKLLDGLVSYTY